MSCTPERPCGETRARLGLVPPAPGAPILRRRCGEFWGFLEELTAAVERLEVDGETLGSSWDLEGDPHGRLLAQLWARVAEGVAAQTELTAGEAYLETARDWTDLRRIAALIGYRPSPGVAAQAWVLAEVDRGGDPLVPAATRVQAPATAARPAQTYEVIADTQLREEWGELTATWVPVQAKPEDRQLRFLGTPGFRAGDELLFVHEQPQYVPPFGGWFTFWAWMLALKALPPSKATALSIAAVTGSSAELGTTLVSFDRDLHRVLDSLTAPYAAYKILATAGPAKRLQEVLRIPAVGDAQPLPLAGAEAIDTAQGRWVILDNPLETLSAGQLVAVVDWHTKACDVGHVKAHEPWNWEMAPGTFRRTSKLIFEPGLAALRGGGGEKSIYVLDRRVAARHYAFPQARPAGAPQLRLYPRPRRAPDRIAVGSGDSDRLRWEVYECRAAVEQEDAGSAGDAPSGLVVDLIGSAPATDALHAPASANLLRVRHGATKTATLGSGDATTTHQRIKVPDAPIAYDLDDSGNPVPTLVLRVEGARWDERPSLHGAGSDPAFATRLAADGALTVEFGDGTRGARPPTGHNNVTARYRVGGGSAGEVDAGAIDTLIGSIRGVKKVRGAGPAAGGADQDDAGSVRRLAPTRARAFGRAVSIEDIVDLSLAYPGVSHAAAWSGAGGEGCACGGPGLHLAFVRAAAGGPRPPLAAETRALSSYLDARRDPDVPLCVCAGSVTRPPLSAVLVTDPRREAGAVAAEALAAVTDPVGALGYRQRRLGQPLDRSDVLAVVHAVSGVVGVLDLQLEGVVGEHGRRGAAPHELVYPPASPSVTERPA